MDQNATIQQLLDETETIAVVGLSSKLGRPGRYVPAYLQDQGYRIIPVNPNIEGALGEPAYDNLKNVPVPVDLVLIFQRSEKVPPFVAEAVEIGAKGVWMQSGIRHEEAADKARAAGLAVVMDACMMVEHRRRGGRSRFRPG